MSDEFDLHQFREIFVAESREQLSALNAHALELEKNPASRDLIDGIFRAAHTLKGMAATMGFTATAELCHALENVLDGMRAHRIAVTTAVLDAVFDTVDLLEALLDAVDRGGGSSLDTAGVLDRLQQVERTAAPPAPAAVPQPEPPPAAPSAAPAQQELPPPVLPQSRAQTIRIKIDHLDRLMDLTGELVTGKSLLAQIGDRERLPDLARAVKAISQNTAGLQEEVLRARMVPVKNIFDRFPRMVRDLAHAEGKEIEFIMSGTDIELDRALLEQISEPLMHLLRNAVDHGIELPAEREAANKPAGGTVTLRARREHNAVAIDVSDDGRGIDIDLVRRTAVEKGLCPAAAMAQMEDTDVLMLVFRPGFSTAKKVSAVSGRGVGLDVVKQAVEACSGRLTLDSRPAAGTTVTVQVPLTMAIIPALLVLAGPETYALPLANVAEIMTIEPDMLTRIEQEQALLAHNEVLSAQVLRAVFDAAAPAAGTARPHAVIIEHHQCRRGLIVDGLIGTREIVVKALTGIARAAKYFSGATILPDGRVALIVDVAAL